MLTSYAKFNFLKFRETLLLYSNNWKISFQDREEIVNDTILKGLETFNESKGNFEGYCRKILKNKLINFTISNRHSYLLIAIDDNDEIFRLDEYDYEKKESDAIALKFIVELKALLSKDELRLFNEIYLSCENLRKVDISKASKNIGLTAAKGWDTFRRIQRRANKLYKEISATDDGMLVEESKVFYYRSLTIDNPSDQIDISNILISEDTSISDGSKEFTRQLRPDQIEQLNQLYDS